MYAILPLYINYCQEYSHTTANMEFDIICVQASMNEFSQWLQEELQERNWNQADLARITGLTTAGVSKLLSSSRGAGPDACRAIARALELPEELVFRKAGLLSPTWDQLTNADLPNVAEWRSILLELTHDNRRELLQIARLKLERQRDQAFTERFKSLSPDQQVEAWNLIEKFMLRKGGQPK